MVRAYFLVLFLPITTYAQGVTLTETPRSGDCSEVEIQFTLKGNLTVKGTTTESMEARANLKYLENTKSVDGLKVQQVARWYTSAAADSMVAGTRSLKKLPVEKRLILVNPTANGIQHFHAVQPLTRDDLDIVAEHFDTRVLNQFLPNVAVKEGDSWAITDTTAANVVLLDKLTSHSLQAKLLSVSDATAEIAVEGKVEGVELGSVVKVNVKAKVMFDRKLNLVSALNAELNEDRSAGPVSPAMAVNATVNVTRKIAEANAELKAVVFPSPKAVEQQLYLTHEDPQGKYSTAYARDWHTTGQTPDHWVVRLMDQNDWVAQATVMALKPNAEGKAMTPVDFKAAVAKQPGWEPSKVVTDGEVPTTANRTLYRITALGKQDGLAVVQSFFLLTSAKGQQVVITIVGKEDQLPKLGTRDVSFVQAITFPAK